MGLGRAGIELTTPGYAVRHVSAVRHITDRALTALVIFVLPDFFTYLDTSYACNPASDTCCRLLIADANSMTPDRDRYCRA